MAARTTPGPETPTLMTQSGSPAPWKAPAMKGLSSGALQNTTSFAAPMQSRSAVRYGGFLDDVTHFLYGIHVDAGLCGADIDGGANEFRFRKCFRDAFNQSVIAGGKALMHQCGIAADEVDADGLCGAVQCLCKANGACTGVWRPPAWRWA